MPAVIRAARHAISTSRRIDSPLPAAERVESSVVQNTNPAGVADLRSGMKRTLAANGGCGGIHPLQSDLADIARVGADARRRPCAAAAGSPPACAGRRDGALRLRARRLGPPALDDDLR